MFGDLFGNVEEQQAEMRKKLAEVTVSAEVGGVTVIANANREILDVQFDKTKLDWNDMEQVQDLVVTAVNNALEKAMEMEQAEAQNLISKMMPPGMSGLFGG